MPGMEIATAWVNLVVSATGVQQSIAKEMGAPVANAAGVSGKAAGKKFAGGVGAGTKGLAGVIGGAFVVSKVTDFFADSTRAVMEWQTLNAQTGAVVKSTGSAAGVTATQVHDLAQSLEASTSSQAESIQAGANMLLTFKNIRNEAGKGNDIFNQSTTALVDYARAMRTDPSSAAIQLGKALNDPVKGISALTRAGVQFTQGQKDQIKAMVEAGDTMGAQKIILAELNGQFGGSGAAYADTYAGKLYQLQDAFGDMGEAIVTAVVPGLMALFGVLTPVFTFLAQNQAVLIGLGVFIGGILVLAIYSWATAMWAANAALFASPVTWIVLAIVAIIAVIIYLATQTTFFQDAWNATMTVVGAVLNWLWSSVIKPVFDAIAAVFTWIWSSIIMPIVNFIVGYIRFLASIYLWLWQAVVKPVFDALAAAWNWIWASVVQPVIGFISGAIRTVGDTVRAVFGGIGKFVAGAFRGLVGIVKGPVNAVIGFLNQAIRTVNGISIPIPSWARGLLGGASSIGFNIPTIPMLASGGTAVRRGTALVGERGPELITMPRGASVIPLSGRNAGNGALVAGDVNLIVRDNSAARAFVGEMQDLQYLLELG